MRHEISANIHLVKGVGSETTPGVTEEAQPPRDEAIAQLAARQHGLVTLRQLTVLGLGDSAVRRRVAAGRLHRVHRGVYSVGHAIISVKGRWLAAVMSCGPGALLSHWSAAALWGLLRTSRAAIDVTALGRAGRKRRGIAAHRADTLLPRDRTIRDGIPVTSLARTLLDLAEVANRRTLERALDRAEQLRLLDVKAVTEAINRAQGRPGAARLKAVLATHTPGSTLTDSEFEEQFLLFAEVHGLPRPETQVWIPLPGNDGYRADFLWPAERLIVETDGAATHGTRKAQAHDRRRDQRLLAAGFLTIRVAGEQLAQTPHEVELAIRAGLAARR